MTVLRLRRCCKSLNGRDDAVAHDEQLAVEHGVERLEGGDDLREAAEMSSPEREKMRTSPPPAAICTRTPSHFHSAEISSGLSPAQSPSSMGCDSISGRNTGLPSALGRGPRFSSQANRSA